MLETGIAVGVVLLFVGVVVMAAAVPVLSLMYFGGIVIAVGFVAGLISGAGYHVAMHRGLKASAIDAPRWWWSPVRYHVQLTPESRRRVMPWFVAGVSGATIAFVGCAILVVCLFRLRGLEV